MAGLLTPAREDREGLLAHGLRLEAFTLADNVVEAGIALTAAWLAGSVALLGFGADSVVESLSAAVLAWRLRREQQGIPEEQIARIEQRTQRLVAASLIALGLFVAAEATRTLAVGRLPGTSWIEIGLTSLSLIVMFVLARAKRSRRPGTPLFARIKSTGRAGVERPPRGDWSSSRR